MLVSYCGMCVVLVPYIIGPSVGWCNGLWRTLLGCPYIWWSQNWLTLFYISNPQPPNTMYGLEKSLLILINKNYTNNWYGLHWLQFFSQKCPLFGFCLISTTFGSLIPKPKSVFGYLVRILQCCQFCGFQARKSNFRKFGKFFFEN